MKIFEADYQEKAKIYFIKLICFIILGSLSLGLYSQTKKYDIVIYGDISAAISAAVEAKRSGKSVIVVSPDLHLGGLSSGGLGFTDTGDKRVIGGLARGQFLE